MEKKIIGLDISNKPDSSIVYVHFRNNGRWDESAVNMPILHNNKPVVVVTEADEDVVKGFIYGMKFYQKRFVDNGKISSASFEIGK